MWTQSINLRKITELKNQRQTDQLLIEKESNIYLNNTFITTLNHSPQFEKEMALGYLIATKKIGAVTTEKTFKFWGTVNPHDKVEGAPGQGTLAILTFARCSANMHARSHLEHFKVPWRSWVPDPQGPNRMVGFGSVFHCQQRTLAILRSRITDSSPHLRMGLRAV